MDWVADKPQNYKDLYGILQLLRGSHLNNFSLKTLKLGWVAFNCWFSHDVTKFQTSELLILLRFYFHDVLEQLKTKIQTNFHSEWVLGLVIDYT